MLRIGLFGAVTITVAEDTPPVPLAGRCASLLAYLALGNGRNISRAELLGNLGSDRGRAASTGSFNTALWRLRRLVEPPPLQHGDVITCDRNGGVSLAGPEGVWLDVHAFDRLVMPGLSLPPERLSDDAIEDMRQGVAMYSADILLNITDDWALREREKHRRNYLNARWRLMQVSAIRRAYPEAIHHAQSILDSDPLREDVHRELIQLLMHSGQRAQALRQFEACRELLRRELAIQPMAETMALYQGIADAAIGGRHAHASDNARTAFAAPPQPPPGAVASPAAGDRPVRGERWPQDLIIAARQQLALADSQLQLSLQFFDT